MPAVLRQRRMRQGAALAVLGLHVLGVGIGLRLGAWSDRHPPPSRQPALTVRLLRWAPPPEQPRPQAAAMPPANQPLKRSAPTEPQTPPDAARPPPSDTLQAITLPAEPGAPAAASAASAPPPPLNLTLPRGASAPWRAGRNLALDDARSNSPKLTLEQKLAEAMGGSGPWVEEPIDADHRRLKRGNTCIYLQRPRAAQLDPFNPANRALPWQAGQPTRC